MIQRIQTVYLFLASISLALIYFFNLWSCKINIEGNEILYSIKADIYLPLLLTLAISFALVLLSVFYFKNRKKQIWFCLLSILSICSFLALCFYLISAIHPNEKDVISSSYTLAILLPFIAITFIILAIWNIRKDEKLIKSLDRLT